MYQAISTMNKEFFLLLVVQASSTFIQCTGLDRYCLSWALSRDFFPEKFRGILTNGDTEYQWKRRLIDSSHTCISTLIVLFLIPVSIMMFCVQTSNSSILLILTLEHASYGNSLAIQELQAQQ